MIYNTSLVVPNLSDIGIDSPICPNCDHQFPKMPGRKIICPECKQTIFVKTRPIDRKKVLIIESEIPIVEKEWEMRKAADRVNRSQLKDALQWIDQYNLPITNISIYSALKELADQALKDKQIMTFCGYLTGMGDIMRAEEKDMDAMLLFMDVLYLNANKADNYRPNLKGSQPFRDKGRVSIPVGLVGYLNELSGYLKMPYGEMVEAFLSESKDLQDNFGLEGPNSDGIHAWGVIQKEYRKYIALQKKSKS